MGVSLIGSGGGSGSGVTKVADATELAALIGMTEGDLAYREDTDDYYYYTGAAWALVLADTDHADLATVISGLSNHLADPTDAHDASAISVSPTGNLASTDAQAALQEHQGDIDTINTTLGEAATISQGSVVYHDANSLNKTSVGTSGQALISGGTGAPTWYAPTLGSVIFAGTGGILSQDNTNFFWNNTDKRLKVGTGTDTITVNGSTKGSALTVSGQGGGNAFDIGFHKHSATLNPEIYSIRSRGSEATQSIVQDGDILGAHSYLGFDGTDYEYGARMTVEVDGTPGNNDMPARIVFYVSPDGGNTPAEALRIASTKTVHAGTALKVGSTTAIDASAIVEVISTTKGTISAPAMTTVQRDAIASPATGLRIYNTTTKRPEYYDGTLWQSESSPNIAAAQTPTDASTPTILGYRRQVLPISGSGGSAVTLADLSVSNNLDGDELMLLGGSDTATVTVVSATNTVLNGNCTLASGNTLTLVLYSGKWYERSRQV